MSARATIGIIGTGWVGTSVAISVLHGGLAAELLLHDRRTEVAEGEAMDLSHGAPFYPPARVHSVGLEAMRATDAVVFSAGHASSAGQSRLELLRANAAIVRGVAAGFRGYAGLIVVVTNPVDAMVQLFQQASGLPPERVIGTGTLLDTARLRQVLGRELALDPRSIHAQVVGEHGDSEVALWSSAQVGGIPLRRWPGWNAAREREIAREVRNAAYEIIRRKGATNHAIGLATAALLKWALRGERRVVTLSRVQTGAFGLSDVALSLPTIVGRGGATEVLEPDVDAAERAGLERSAAVLRKAVEAELGSTRSAG